MQNTQRLVMYLIGLCVGLGFSVLLGILDFPFLVVTAMPVIGIIGAIMADFLMGGEEQCPRCGAAMVRWSAQRWHCAKCGYKQYTGW